MDASVESLGDAASARSETLSSVANAFRLLKQFREAYGEMGVTELANAIGVGKSTAHRLIQTLVSEGLLERNDATGRYHLGVVVHELGLAVPVHKQLHQAAGPVIEQMRHRTGEAVYVGVLRGRENFFVDTADADFSGPVRTKGNRAWAHTTAIGKVLLAHLPPEELDQLLQGWRLVRRTPNTITDHKTLLEELERIRRQGYAINVGESVEGVVTAAAAIRAPNGRAIAALTVAAPESRTPPMKLRAYARLCMDGAHVISNRLAHLDAKAN